MTAYKCDRCGRFYLRNEKYHPRNMKVEPIRGLRTVQQFGDAKIFELCDDCLTEFFERFMNWDEAK